MTYSENWEAKAMSDDMLEILDANIVVILDDPITLSMSTLASLEESKLVQFIRKPLALHQVLGIDPSLGATAAAYQIESMRSQKTIHLNPIRIEVHDRSGEADFKKAQIPETMMALVSELNVGRIKAVGANWEIMFKAPGDGLASAVIAEKLLRRNGGLWPQGIKPVGGGVRLFLSDEFGENYTLSIEPRGLNVETDKLWMTCNTNVTEPEDLSGDLLRDMFERCYSLIFSVKESLFSQA
jgi:hypothetical protein